MTLEAFDTVAGMLLATALPMIVVLVAVMVHHAGVRGWWWTAYLAGVVGVLVWFWYQPVGYPLYPDLAQPDHVAYGNGDDAEWLGKAVGWLGTAVNGAVAFTVGITRPRPTVGAAESGRRRRAGLAPSLLAVLALTVPLVVYLTGGGLIGLWPGLGILGAVAALVTLRRQVVPDVLVAVAAAGCVVAIVGAAGIGTVDPAADRAERRARAADARRDAARAAERERRRDVAENGRPPATTTRLGAESIRRGLESVLDDTIAHAAPFTDLSSPTGEPLPAPDPEVTVGQRTGGRTRLVATVLLQVEDFGTVERSVLGVWERAGYTLQQPIDTDSRYPLRHDLALEELTMHGDQRGIIATLSTFCAPGL